MDDARLAHLAYQSLYPFYELIASGHERSRIVRLGGVCACVVPEVPERSFMNAVVYDDSEALVAALPDLAGIYDSAGVKAWTVWTRTGDRKAAAALEQAGHTLDATPAAMAMPLAGWEPAAGRGARIGPIDVAGITRINDAAYGWEGEFTRGFMQAPDELRRYGASVDGDQVACAAWLRIEDDCTVYMVACLPEAQGHGLATDLMNRMLSDARAEGCTTTTLQSSKAGYPIYRRLGYRDLGRLEMWERRSQSTS
jgi:GNAT superfamily N-acetyltransferase